MTPALPLQRRSPRWWRLSGFGWLLALALLLLTWSCSTIEPKPAPEAPGNERDQPAEPAPAAEAATPPAEAVPQPAVPDSVAVPEDDASAVADPTVPLPERERALFAALRPDPEPEALIRDNHYWASNEDALWVWHDDIVDIGGVFVGVGTDQDYVLAAWSRPAVLVLLDFDGAIADMHMVYRAGFKHAATPEAFVALWAEANAPATKRMLKEEYAGDPRLDAILYAFAHGRDNVERRLNREVARYQRRHQPIVFTDQTQYDFIRTLWEHGRVFPIRGDLTGDLAMLSVADAARAARLDVTVLYLSNTEQYFDYTPAVRRNFLAMPYGERSVILRTRHTARFGTPEGDADYHYNVQSAHNFARWMEKGTVTNGWRLLRRVKPSDIPGLTRILEEPKVKDEVPVIAPRPEELERSADASEEAGD